MQKNTHISRLFSVFLMSLVMLFTVFGKNIHASQNRHQELGKVKTEQSQDSKAPKQCSVSELSVMQVSVPINIDFAQDFIFKVCEFAFLKAEPNIQAVQNLSFRLPHLEVLFEHFIVTNAP
ncbi:hypothetical protein [Arcicella rigui]|uniref:Uncharacterized protein n=1 Tax=Arcicella rigui TaxID=797020 RepID=A0ABU5Q7R8_9BACT|nr:hypothetical protein [Arcicella rigui]MEA5138891.1 hypothetical protein [Arcicella rigui]